MRLKAIPILLSLLLVPPNICLAEYSDSYEASSSGFSEEGIERNITIVNEDGTTISGVADLVTLHDDYHVVPPRANVSLTDKENCGDYYTLTSEGYDIGTTAAIAVDCGEESEFVFTVSTEKDSLTAAAKNGTITILGIPHGKFTAHIKNTLDKPLNCSASIVAMGQDSTPEEGFPIFLKCFKDDSSSSAASAIKSIGSSLVGAAMFLLLLI